VPQAAFSPLGRRAQEEWPPFLGGRLRLQILMAVSVWGPMRLMEIAQLTGESAHAKSHWNKAARYLESCGILICQKKHQRHLVLGLDRRHPAHREIQWLGKKLYEIYLKPMAQNTPKKRKNPLPAPGPKYDPGTVNLHFLGRVNADVLHLIVETHSSPSYVLVNGLGHSRATFGAIVDWEKYGIVLTRFNYQRPNRRKYSVHLNTTWAGYYALHALLKRLNSWMPEYAEIANAYRAERYLGHEKQKWKARQARLKRKKRPA